MNISLRLQTVLGGMFPIPITHCFVILKAMSGCVTYTTY